jgi:hypothetical protein
MKSNTGFSCVYGFGKSKNEQDQVSKFGLDAWFFEEIDSCFFARKKSKNSQESDLSLAAM